MSIDPANIYGAHSEALPAPSAMSAAPTRTHAWKDGAAGFHDFLDAINPLQHIPVVSAIYRWLTGDVPGNVAQLAGDTLYGGPVGLATGLFGVAFKEETGKDPGAMAIALLGGGSGAPAAAAAPEPPAAPILAADASAGPATPSLAPAQPPIPLVKAPAAIPLPSAASNFLAQSALHQRSLVGARPVTQAIPLKLSGQTIPLAPLHMPPAAAAPAMTATAPTAAADVPPTADVPQRMLDALDKYRALEQQRGGAVDLRQ
jgi:hypothetical protein